MNKVNLIRKISVKDTILSLPIGKPTPIKNSVIPYLKLKRSVDYLKTLGHDIKLSVAGRLDDTVVTRLK